MEESVKIIFPTINWENYRLVDFKKSANTWKFAEIYFNRLTVTIEESTDIPEWFDKHIWHSHGYVEAQHDDRPIRDNAVTIIERRKRRKNIKTGIVHNSTIMWVQTLEGTRKPEDILYFLK